MKPYPSAAAGSAKAVLVVVEGGEVPLSEEEQRILHEMEQRLYEHDRAFVDRVRSETPRTLARRSARWAVFVFCAGFAVLLVSFRSSLLLGTFGFLVMLCASLMFERSARQAYGRNEDTAGPSPRHLLGRLRLRRDR